MYNISCIIQIIEPATNGTVASSEFLMIQLYHKTSSTINQVTRQSISCDSVIAHLV